MGTLIILLIIGFAIWYFFIKKSSYSSKWRMFKDDIEKIVGTKGKLVASALILLAGILIFSTKGNFYSGRVMAQIPWKGVYWDEILGIAIWIIVSFIVVFFWSEDRKWMRRLFLIAGLISSLVLIATGGSILIYVTAGISSLAAIILAMLYPMDMLFHKSSSDYSSSGSSYTSSSSFDYARQQQAAQVIMKLLLNGDSCSTCNKEYNGMCPYEGGYQKPDVNGTQICHKHSNA